MVAARKQSRRWLWVAGGIAAVGFGLTAQASAPIAGAPAGSPATQAPPPRAVARPASATTARTPAATKTVRHVAARAPAPNRVRVRILAPASVPAAAFKGAIAGAPPTNPAAAAAASAAAAAKAALEDPCGRRIYESTAPPLPELPVQSPDEALNRLITGNDRFMDDRPQGVNRSHLRRDNVAKTQAPFAIVLGCVDSRVPPEIIFDRGLGDLFVIRTAGHVVDDAALGSIEFGTEELHIQLVVVLGHERCGAVKATMDITAAGTQAPDEINTIVNGVRPAILKALGSKGDALDAVVKANVQLTVNRLRRVPLLAEAIAKGRLKIVGARYDLDTGGVEVITP